MMTIRNIVIFALASAVFLGWPGAAYAYLDPGTGSLIIQSVIGAIAGAAAVVGIYWGKMKAFVLRLRDSGRGHK